MVKKARFICLIVSVFLIWPSVTLVAQNSDPFQSSPSALQPNGPLEGGEASDSVVKTQDSSGVSIRDDVSLGSPASASIKPVEDYNPYGLRALWQKGDFIARFVLLILLVMSVGTWAIMIIKFLQQKRIIQFDTTLHDAPLSIKNIKGHVNSAAGLSCHRHITNSILRSHEQYTKSNSGIDSSVDLFSWITLAAHRSVNQVQSSMQDGLAFLGTVGSTAPFIGLFGTVIGIYRALTAIGISGQATIDKVAGPVGEALIMTAVGLAVAVPAVLGYNLLVRRNKKVMDRIRDFSAEMQTIILSGQQVREGTGSLLVKDKIIRKN